MRRLLAHLSAVLLVVSFTQPLRAQQNGPHIGYVYPAGGTIGKTFQVTIGGQSLAGVNVMRITGSGIDAKIVEHIIPLNGKQALLLRDELKALLDRKSSTTQAATRPWREGDDKRVTEIRKLLATFKPRPASPAIAETVIVQVEISPAAELGDREVRLVTPNGVTNPLVFEVGRLDEFAQRPAETEQRNRENEQRRSHEPPETRITLPQVINGQIMPGAADRYRFAARKGAHLVAIVHARKLIPYLADAVPGWFQPTLALYNARGKELAYDDDFRFQPDPVLHYLIPADGDYTIEIKDSIYRGREDFVYRISIGELPFVTSIFPLGGRAGERTNVQLIGWNLPSSTAIFDATDKDPGVYPFCVTKRPWNCNSPLVAIDTLPECIEQEPNNSIVAAQSIKLPMIINGRISKPGEWDIFSFDLNAGQKIVADVFARRLDSPLDSVLRLLDATGNQVAFNDDNDDKADGLRTHHADSTLIATAPTTGRYFIYLGDVQHRGGPEYTYRLRLSHPRPDFDLRIVPSSITIRGGCVPVTVHAMRKDEFTGPIDLRLEDAPEGFVLTGARIPPNQDRVRITLASPPSRLAEPITLHMQGSAALDDGTRIVHEATPADDMMQAFLYRHLVRAQELVVTSTGAGPFKNAIMLETPLPIQIPLGGSAKLRFIFRDPGSASRTQLGLSDPPEGISVQKLSTVGGTVEMTLKSDPNSKTPATEGNLIVTASPNNAPTTTQPTRRPMRTLRAVPFQFIAK